MRHLSPILSSAPVALLGNSTSWAVDAGAPPVELLPSTADRGTAAESASSPVSRRAARRTRHTPSPALAQDDGSARTSLDPPGR